VHLAVIHCLCLPGYSVAIGGMSVSYSIRQSEPQRCEVTETLGRRQSFSKGIKRSQIGSPSEFYNTLLASALQIDHILFNQSSNCLPPPICFFPRQQKSNTQSLPSRHKHENEDNMKLTLLSVLVSATVAFAAPLLDKRISARQVSNCTPGQQCLFSEISGTKVFGNCLYINVIASNCDASTS
jgi:hypothetical protein